MFDFSENAKAFIRLSLMRLSRYPENVTIEVTTHCNFSCEMCYLTAFDLEKKHIDPDVFLRIIDELPKSIKRISLSGLGEGLMNPKIPQYLALCGRKHPSAILDFTTNGFLLEGTLKDDIINSPVKMVTFSLDTVGEPIPSVGHKISKRIINNIQKFAIEANERHPKILLRLQPVVFSWNQVKELLFFAKNVGFDSINLVRMDTPGNRNYKRIPVPVFRSIFRRAKAFGLKNGIPVVSSAYHNIPMRLASHFDKLCLQYHNFLYFTVDGDVLPCCVLRDYSFGNITQLPLSTIWKSSKMTSFFKMQKHVCKNCDVWRHNYIH